MSDNELAAHPRVLIVDDSRMVRASISRLIRDAYEVREEGDGEAGWQTLLLDPTLQVVISDLSMPKLDGYGLLEHIRASKISRIQAIPVIMISGDEDDAARAKAKDLGATDFITKGIGTVELLTRLQGAIQAAQMRRELEESRQALADQKPVDPKYGLVTAQYLLKPGAQMLSADVWSHPELLRLAADGRPAWIAGVPPDYFSATGQCWGNPLYRWDALERTGYAWWVSRLRAALELVDSVRLDHFRGFEAYWEVAGDATTAVDGRWVKGPGAALFEALRGALGELPIVAEDLGVITPEVEALRDGLGLPGMAILQFAFGSDAHANDFLPHNYPRRKVVYTISNIDAAVTPYCYCSGNI